ncbi:MAG TPA: hypothetical protein VNL91_11370 [Thermoanaerobaculia bacterium]|nr:hypothetical protein [Thermoanaerobaculia bacterium]
MREMIKWAVIVGAIVAAWKYGAPLLESRRSPAASAEPGSACGASARRAAEAWGSGLGRFVRPPYDLAAWDTFRSLVDDQIEQAEKDCGCGSESCAKGMHAMRELRSLMSDLDTAVRNGSPLPGDVVQRQEAIDNAIDSL